MTFEQTLLAVMTAFVVLSAIALCIQAAMLVGLAKTAKGLQEQVNTVLPQAKSVLTTAEAILADNRKNIADITSRAVEIAIRANEIASKASDQMVKLDAVFSDATGRAKVQLEHAEMVVNDTMNKVNQSVTAVHGGIVKPIRELQALNAGLHAALQHFLRGGRPSVADATHDDEMFIG